MAERLFGRALSRQPLPQVVSERMSATETAVHPARRMASALRVASAVLMGEREEEGTQ